MRGNGAVGFPLSTFRQTLEDTNATDGDHAMAHWGPLSGSRMGHAPSRQLQDEAQDRPNGGGVFGGQTRTGALIAHRREATCSRLRSGKLIVEKPQKTAINQSGFLHEHRMRSAFDDLFLPT
jgi:hypothetical protein